VYKGNGVITAFPIPAGADGRQVWISGEGFRTRASEGEAYEIADGSVIFASPPPAGTEISFAETAAAASGGPVCTVIYPDGTVRNVYEDPMTLLAEAREERARSAKSLAEVRAECERAGLMARNYESIAKETLSARLDKYREAVDESVRHAAELARDEINDNIDRKILEIRKKHAEVRKLADEMEAMTAEAAREAREEIREEIRTAKAEMAPALEAAGEVRSARSAIEEIVSAERLEASRAAERVIAEFAARSEGILREFGALKAALETEVRSAAIGALERTAAALDEIRRHRTDIDTTARALLRAGEERRERREARREERLGANGGGEAVI
jgi:hypothetical protein